MGSNPTAHSVNSEIDEFDLNTGDKASGDKPDMMKVDKFIASLMDDLRHNRLELPTLPQVAARIHKVVENPNSRAKDVAQAVGSDMALSARIIHVANSPILRGQTEIDNVQSAVTRMGSNMVRNIITSFLVKQLFHTNQKSLQVRMANIWNHSAHVAAISHVLAARYTDFQADEVMLTGLLHDIGKLPILAKARAIPSLQNKENEKALDMVIERLHPALGKAILEAWKFPSHIVAAAAEHEQVNRNSKSLDYTDVVIVANLHSYIGKSAAKKVDWTNVPAMKKLKLDPDMSIGVLEEAREEILEIQKVLSI